MYSIINTVMSQDLLDKMHCNKGNLMSLLMKKSGFNYTDLISDI